MVTYVRSFSASGHSIVSDDLALVYTFIMTPGLPSRGPTSPAAYYFIFCHTPLPLVYRPISRLVLVHMSRF
jgi:hypothetical protein